ncbi:MAG: hypothetical protein J2P45_20780 [Candidatus Dormibacteraeota bacterium]|nr:hypothetical protein [Candidatus Dormibacteraeota bacterium]
MTGLVVFCRSCGRQVQSSEVRDGLCLDCRVTANLGDLRDEHRRLWLKRERYERQGANVASIGRQIARVEDRMAERIRELVPDEERGVELLKRELEQARQSRYDIRRR